MEKKIERRVCLAFDLDDTLMPTIHKYHLPMIECLKIICKELKEESLHPLEVLQKFDEKDRLSWKSGFHRGRFGKAWEETYKEICREKKITPKTRVEKKIFKTASKFDKGPFKIDKEIIEIIKKLRKRFYLVLVTAGDHILQQRKIKASRIGKYFDEVKVVNLKKEEVLKQLAERFGHPHTWMIGNSLRSDVEAALKAGIRCVHIPKEIWSFERSINHEAQKKFHHQVIRIMKFSDLEGLIPLFLL